MKYYNAVGGLARTHAEMIRDIPCLVSFQELARCKSLPKDVFIDSGAFYYFIRQKKNEYPVSIEQYLTVLEKFNINWFAFQDFPTHDCIFSNGIERTIERMYQIDSMLDSFDGLREKAIPVIQGTKKEHYIRTINKHKKLLKKYNVVAIGSVCMADFWNYTYPLVCSLPTNCKYHIFGQQPWTIPYFAGIGTIMSVDGGDAAASASKHKKSNFGTNWSGRYVQYPQKSFEELFLENIEQIELFKASKQKQLEIEDDTSEDAYVSIAEQ